ncbi:glycerol-3-phosphate 1-O-acyltransferase PlsY [Mogibacterium pumilum]|nr:glycerol-3-phosphate 1-O-acyltransferase PlsY [Mogibacterium pumilum]
MKYLPLIIMVIVAYFIGNISPATLIARFYGIDIKKAGSGNAGTTNVLRVLGTKAAVCTLLIDVFKGFIAVSIAQGNFNNLGAMLAFAAVVIGHIYPIVFKFRGGKGVATFFGAAMAINWPSMFAAALIAIVVAAISKKMSLGSILAAMMYPLLMLYYYPKAIPIAVFMTFVIIFTHHDNIKRLMKGEEKELSIGSKIKAKLREQLEEADSEKTDDIKVSDISKKTGASSKTTESLATDNDSKSEISADESIEKAEAIDSNTEDKDDIMIAGKKNELVNEATAIEHTKIEVAEEPVDYYKDVVMPKLKTDEKRVVSVIGNGSFGTAIANVIAHNGYRVTVYGRNKEDVNKTRESRVNEKYLPGAILHEKLRFTSNVRTAVGKRDIIIFAIPAQQFGSFLEKNAKYIDKNAIIVNLAKGIENKSLKTMSQIAKKSLKNKYVAVSGPSHAEEIVRNYPTTVVAASSDEVAAKEIQNILMSKTFRVYTSNDIIGVELGGALKNVIALGTGIADGMNFGDNSKAALMTRGIHEISRLGESMGAKSETFAGLSGIGDLMVTCSSDLSRNRRCGLLIGGGMTPEEAVAEIKTTVEGFYTVEAASKLAKKLKVDMPITNAIKAVIDGKLNPRDAVEMLMNRDRKQENK